MVGMLTQPMSCASVGGRTRDAVSMPPVFLIGGGRGDGAVRASHTPFVNAVAGRPVVAVVLDEGEDTDVERWSGSLTLAGAAEVRALVVSKERPPLRGDFE